MAHKFDIGEEIGFVNRFRPPSAPRPTYTVVGFRPDQDGEPAYRIKGDLESYERTVLESDLKAIAKTGD